MHASTEGLAITLDVDWAPDHVIDSVAARLIEHNVRATWFVTHASAAIDRLRRHPELFELGIHPNFLPNSSQGRTMDEVLAFCMALVPDAKVMRTHCLMGSTPLLGEAVIQTPVRIDSSILMRRHPGLQPVAMPYAEGTLLRLPIWWEDDIEHHAADAMWDLSAPEPPGLRILDFHPVQIALNTAVLAPYLSLKRAIPRLTEATPADIASRWTDGPGSSTAFDSAIRLLAAAGGGPTLSMLAASWDVAGDVGVTTA